MNKSTHCLTAGARGWQHPGWCDNYYPDDLPEDWRLDFYANEFRQVLLPCADWIKATPEDAEQWLEASDDDFRFFVETTGSPTSPLPLDTLKILGGRLAGICVADADGDDRLAALAPLYRRQPLAAIAPFSTCSQCLPLDTGASNARLVIAAGIGEHSPLQLRGYAEALRGSAQGRTETLVFFDGDPPEVGDIRILQQLGELL